MKTGAKRLRTTGRMWAAGAIAAALAAGARGDTIRLKSAVRLSPGIVSIRLADIAELEGAQANRWAETIVAQRPAPHVVKEIDASDVRAALSSAGLDWGLVSLTGEECIIRPASATASVTASESAQREGTGARGTTFMASAAMGEGTIRAVVARCVAQDLLNAAPEDVEISVDESDAAYLKQTTEGLEVEALPQGTMRSARLPIVIKTYRDGTFVDQCRITVRVMVRQKVLTTKRQIARGEMVTEEMIRTEIRMAAPSTRNPIHDAAEVTGKKANGQLQAGQILREGDVALPVLVERQDQVLLRACFGELLIRMPARALEAGRVGDTLRVKRDVDGVIVEGRVDADGEITMETMPTAVEPQGD